MNRCPARCEWTFFEAVETDLNFHSLLFEDCDHPISCLMVALSYVLLVFAFVWTAGTGFRNKRPGMPLVGLCALMAPGIVVLANVPPLSRWFGTLSGPTYFPEKISQFAIAAWWLHVGLLMLVFIQYLLHGRAEVKVPFVRRYFLPLVLLTLAAVTNAAWLFVIFYADFYVNEVYPVGTLMMAGGYLGAAVTRRRNMVEREERGDPSPPQKELRSLSVLAAWAFAIGTALLYLGTIFGGLENGYHDHEESGYCLVYWVYTATPILLIAYAWLVTKFRRNHAPGPDRPCL